MDPEMERLLELNPAQLEEVYRARELYRSTRVGAPVALRLDGVGWGRRLRGRYRWPRDPVVHRWLCRGAMAALELLGADAAYVTSDEVSLLWVWREPPYGGRVEKLDSIAAAVVTARVSLGLGLELPLDSRVVKLYSPRDAFEYVAYRARVGFNNYVASLYHAVTGSRETPGLGEMLSTLARHGYPVDALPRWALLGSCVLRLPSTRRVEPGNVLVARRRIAAVEGYDACSLVLAPGGGETGGGG